MKKIFVILLVVLVSSPALISAKEWYEGGTLQNATVREFINGAPENKMATAAYWVAATIDPAYASSVPDSDFAIVSTGTILCIENGVSLNKKVLELKAESAALICLKSLKKKYPWIMSKK